MKDAQLFNSLKRSLFLVGCAGGVLMGLSQTVVAHGTLTSPASRIWNCYQEGPQTPQSAACQAVAAAGGATSLYDWNGIRQGDANGNHQAKVPNGQLCSGGDPNYFKGQDLTRNDWVSTNISAGSYTFRWNNPAAHKTLYYRYYITNNGYNPSSPLQWSDLSLICDTGPEDALNNPAHTCNIPARSGRHVIYGVWQRSDSPEAFYACSDVVFGGSSSIPASSSSSSSVGSSSSAGGAACSNVPVWNANTIYTEEDQVQLSGIRYEAKWWTQGDNPAAGTGDNYVWTNQGSCSGETGSSSSSSSSAVTNPSSSSSSSVASGNCTSAPFSQGTTYATGATVVNGGSEYECTVGGWCTVGGPYEPGAGWAWSNAWTLLRSCN